MGEKKFYQLPSLPADLCAEEISALWEFTKMSSDDRKTTQEYMNALLADRDHKTDSVSESDHFSDDRAGKDNDPVLDFLDQIKLLSSRIMHEVCSITSYVYLQHCVYEINVI